MSELLTLLCFFFFLVGTADAGLEVCLLPDGALLRAGTEPFTGSPSAWYDARACNGHSIKIFDK